MMDSGRDVRRGKALARASGIAGSIDLSADCAFESAGRSVDGSIEIVTTLRHDHGMSMMSRHDIGHNLTLRSQMAVIGFIGFVGEHTANAGDAGFVTVEGLGEGLLDVLGEGLREAEVGAAEVYLKISHNVNELLCKRNEGRNSKFNYARRGLVLARTILNYLSYQTWGE